MQKYFDINESGYSIRCKLYCNDVHAIKKAVIFGHGFGGHKDNKAAEKFAAKLISKHREFCVVTFNWPCHGDDARKNLLLGECDTYLTTVIEYVKREFHTDEIYGYATSFGGYLFLKYIAEHKEIHWNAISEKIKETYTATEVKKRITALRSSHVFSSGSREEMLMRVSSLLSEENGL